MLSQQPIMNLIEQLQFVIEELSDEQYVTPVYILSNSTIGQHLRHIIEFYLELNNGYDDGTVNYDRRKRDYAIESNRDCAIEKLNTIRRALFKEDKDLLLAAELSASEAPVKVPTNYSRELIYNLEHTVHHMALMRIGISAITDLVVPEEFGVAASTIKYRQTCAQ